MSQEHNGAPALSAGSLRLWATQSHDGILAISDAEWPSLALEGLLPALNILNREWLPETGQVRLPDKETLILEYSFACAACVTMSFQSDGAGLVVSTTLENNGPEKLILQQVSLLQTSRARLDEAPESVRILTQGNYWGRVVSLAGTETGEANAAAGEPNAASAAVQHASDLVSVVYGRDSKRAFLAGFETSERWLGQIQIARTEQGDISLRLYFDGGDLVIEPGEEVVLETVVLLSGSDPWALLEQYADRVQRRHDPQFSQTPPVSWCSWYPYRLGVTQERLLETARIAADRLKPLGLSIIEVDLGWERDQLPSTFEENDQFSRGLKWLSDELAELGLDLGVWKAPFTISEFDPLVSEHPEWLIQDESGKPAAYWTWFWKPHGNVYILDLTHPGAREWLRGKYESLRERGVRYLKSDFIGCVSHALAKRRHDPHIVSGGGTEAARIGARIMRETLPDALLLNCGGPEMPGTGHWPLLYTCSDTGNTGFLTADFQRENYQTLACHLFKNKRWGIIQPSCLCVGLPGTIEEARLRATLAFLAGGQIDISDTLATLPEDRWAVLTATLPPLGLTAKPVDLFDAVYGQREYGYATTCQEAGEATEGRREHSPGSVWRLRVKSDWDEWDLVAVYSFDARAANEDPNLSHYAIPLEMLGLVPEKHWGYEFWSRQFLGEVPGNRTNPRDYAHPGDIQDLGVGEDPSVLEIAFFGPGVKLLCLRRPRPHPWVVGTSFHQSCGTELEAVTWCEETATLRGEIRRPEGESGTVVIAPNGLKVASCVVEGMESPLLPGAHDAIVLPITMRRNYASWQVTFKP